MMSEMSHVIKKPLSRGEMMSDENGDMMGS